MKTKSVAHKLLLLAVATAFAGSASANECLMDWFTHEAPIVGKSDSWAIATSQAKNTWDDWIWRGPTFYCNPAGGDCTYSWSQSNTKGYSWAVGGKVGVGSIPIVGKIVGSFELNGTYTRSTSWTETFGWTQTIRRGQHAQPVQVVVRRWKQGYFQGADRLIAGSNCSDGGSWYYWDGNARYGSWSANVDTGRYAKYNIW